MIPNGWCVHGRYRCNGKKEDTPAYVKSLCFVLDLGLGTVRFIGFTRRMFTPGNSSNVALRKSANESHTYQDSTA